jgi:transcriptional regulator with XRE-family HTH domain
MQPYLPNRQTSVNPIFAKWALACDRPLALIAKMAQRPDTNRIRECRERAGLTLEQLAERSGISISYLSRMESGSRNVTMKNLRTIASALGIAPERMISGEIAPTIASEAVGQMPIKGEVRAGAWLEIDGEHEDMGAIPVLPDPRFARAPQYALRVVGTSMDRIVQSGQYVIVASWPELGLELRDGDLLVVRRERAMTYQVTLKRARKGEKGWELWPESTDPRWQEPVIMGDGGRDVTVSIIGRVVGRYEPL